MARTETGGLGGAAVLAAAVLAAAVLAAAVEVKRTSAKLGFIKWNESMNLGNQLIRPQIDQIGTGEESQLGMFHIRHLVLWYTLVIDPKLLPPQFCCTAQFFSDHLNISLLTGDFHHNFASSLKYAMK